MILNKLFLNNNHTKNPDGSLAKAKNVIFDDNFETLKYEEGFAKLHEFTEDICGIIPTDIENIIFTTDGNGTDSIYRCSENTATICLKGDLSLSVDNPVKGEYQYNNKGDLIVAFNDTHNEFRVFNFDDPYMELNPTTKEFIDVTDGINKLRMFPDFTVPSFSFDDRNQNNKGNLPKGTYHVVLSYYIGDHDRLNWSLPSLPYSIYKTKNTYMRLTSIDPDYPGTADNFTNVVYYDNFQLNSEEVSGSSVEITINNLDTRYSKYKLAIIYRTETDTKVYDLGDYDTTVSYHNITKLTETELSLDEVSIPYINLGILNDFTVLNGRVYTLGNLTNDSDFNYQKYANNIEVTYGSAINYDLEVIGPLPTEIEEFNAVNIRTPIPDEVYALNIGLVGTDGTVKGIFHIPGRPPEPWKVVLMENYPIMDQDRANYNITGNNNLPDEEPQMDYYYQLHNTADVGYGKLAYWENVHEVYPDKEDFEIWDVDSNGIGSKIDTLVGENVRHHKMPDLEKINAAFYETGNSTRRSIYLNVSNVKFPAELLSKIQGFFICYSNRDSSNATVLGHYPLVRNTFYKNPTLVGDTDNHKLRFNDDSIMFYKPAIAKPYLKGIYKVNLTLHRVSPYYNSDSGAPISFVPDTTKVSSYNSEIRNVNSYYYIPKDNNATDPDNNGREESLILHVDNYYEDTSDTLVCSLKSNLEDVYSPFYTRRVSLASNVRQVTAGTYSYGISGITSLDGFLSHHRVLHFQGDKTLTFTDSELDREGDNIRILTAINYVNYGVVNSNLIARTESNIVVGDEGVRLLGTWGTKYNGISYTGNIDSDPSKGFGFTYNKAHSYTNSIVPYYTYDSNNIFVDNHPFRVSKSAVQNKESLVLNWRYFSALEYKEMVKYRGVGISIQGIDKLLLIHMEHSLFIAQAKDKVNIPDGDAYIGTADIFEREPDELIPTGYGAAGIQSRFGYCVNELGYIFADTYEKNLYSFSNNNLSVLTTHANREFFKKYLNKSDGNPLTDNDIILGVDHLKNRIIITNVGNNPFTISYCYDTQVMDFVSLHSYIPSLMVNNRLGSYSVNSENLKEFYKFNAGPQGTYYDGVKYEAFIDVLINANKPQTDKILYSVDMMSGLYDDNNNITKLFVYNRNQCSKIYTLSEMTSITDFDKIRFLEGVWNYDMIRDYSSDDISQDIVDDFGNINLASINETKNWYELGDIHGRFFIVRLITNTNNDMRFRDLGYNVSLNRR